MSGGRDGRVKLCNFPGYGCIDRKVAYYVFLAGENAASSLKPYIYTCIFINIIFYYTEPSEV